MPEPPKDAEPVEGDATPGSDDAAKTQLGKIALVRTPRRGVRSGSAAEAAAPPAPVEPAKTADPEPTPEPPPKNDRKSRRYG